MNPVECIGGFFPAGMWAAKIAAAQSTTTRTTTIDDLSEGGVAGSFSDGGTSFSNLASRIAGPAEHGAFTIEAVAAHFCGPCPDRSRLDFLFRERNGTFTVQTKNQGEQPI